MEKAGPSSRNPERQLPNKRKRYSSKFLYFRRQVALAQFFPNWKTTKSKRILAEKYNAWFSLSSISFDESTALHVMYRGLFVAREQKRKNWTVIHRTFPFLQRQSQLEQSICMFILRLNVDGQLVNSRSVSQSVFNHCAALTESQTLSSIIYSKKLYFIYIFKVTRMVRVWIPWIICFFLRRL